jgi:hypothetical protein
MASNQGEFIAALYLWLDALLEGNPAEFHRHQMSRMALTSSTHENGHIHDLQRLLKHHECEKR